MKDKLMLDLDQIMNLLLIALFVIYGVFFITMFLISYDNNDAHSGGTGNSYVKFNAGPSG